MACLVWLWRMIFILVTVLFFARFIFSPFCKEMGVSWTASIMYFVACLVLLYISFIVEGIVLALSKIEDYDDRAMISVLKEKFGPEDSLGPNLVRAKRSTNAILIGQPLCAIVITFVLATVLDKVSIQKIDFACADLSGWTGFMLPLFRSGAGSDVIAALLLYWISQVLPQSLGKRSSIAFMGLRGAMLVADMLALIQRSGVGGPGIWLERFAGKLGFDMSETNLPLGDSKFLEAMSTDYTRYVARRSISIRPELSGIYISDQAEHKYVRKRRDVRHVFRVPRGQYDADAGVELKLTFPNEISREPVKHRKFFSYVFDRDYAEAKGSDDSPKAPAPNFVSGETIFIVESSCQEEISETTLDVEYVCRDNRLDPNLKGEVAFYFPLGLPTAEVNVKISCPPGGFIYSAKLLFASEEAKFFDRPSEVKRGMSHPEGRQPNGDYHLFHEHPPLATEMIVLIDVRKRDEINGSNDLRQPKISSAASVVGAPQLQLSSDAMSRQKNEV